MNRSPVINADASRPMPVINHIGIVSLYSWEMRRYLKGWQHSIAGPITNTLLFLAIFALALAGLRADVGGLPFLHYVAPGLVIMTAMTTAFEMVAWSIIDAKIRGSLGAFLSAPLRPIEFVGVVLAAGISAGALTGSLALLLMQFFVPLVPVDPLLMLVYLLPACLLTAAAGLIAGVCATKFDHVANVAGLLVSPLVFLSGVFFPIGSYGWNLDLIVRFSPAFWAIEGFREGFVGLSEASLATTLPPLLGAAVLMVFACHRIVVTGYKIKQ
jgi:ABC-2 type transport system permease protein